MAKKKTSHKGKGYYKVYADAGLQYKNKVARIERHLKKYPNDEQAKAALDTIKKGGITAAYKRKKPLTRPWRSKPAQIFAQMQRKAKAAVNAAMFQKKSKNKKSNSVSTIGDLLAT